MIRCIKDDSEESSENMDKILNFIVNHSDMCSNLVESLTISTKSEDIFMKV